MSTDALFVHDALKTDWYLVVSLQLTALLLLGRATIAFGVRPLNAWYLWG